MASGELIFWRSAPWDHPDQKALIQILSTACARMSWTFLVLDGITIQNVKFLRHASNVVLWSGSSPDARYLLEMRRRLKMPTLTVDQGWLPQRDHFALDFNGVMGDSSLCEDSLDWVGEHEFHCLDELCDTYWPEDWRQPGRRRNKSKKVLVLGQYMDDVRVIGFTSISSPEELLIEAEERFGRDDIAFRPHPLDPNVKQWAEICDARGIDLVDSSSELIEAVQPYRGVFTINSTGMYEAALLGLSATPIGECPMANHNESDESVERLLAAMASRQFRKDCEDVIPVLDRMGEFGIRQGG